MPLRENLTSRITRKSPSDWAHVLAFGAIGWPWLLRSLHGGSKAARRALHDKLDLTADALPHLGSWKADAAFLDIIATTIFLRRPEIVVEFGMGATTLVAARAIAMNGTGQLISFDQHEDYVTSVRHWLADHSLNADLRYAPLSAISSNWPGRWYAYENPPESIDLLIIDGPPWAVHPYARGAAEALFDRIPSGGAVLMDDGARPGERVIASRWKKNWPEFDFRLSSESTKGTLIGDRR